MNERNNYNSSNNNITRWQTGTVLQNEPDGNRLQSVNVCVTLNDRVEWTIETATAIATFFIILSSYIT